MVEEKVYIDPETGNPIPMKDGKPCRVCVDFKTWAKLGKSKKEENSSNETKKEAKRILSKEEEEWRRENCPADVKTLGRHTWTLLHTMAAYYPEKPSSQQQESMKTFFESFSEHYPCWFCKVILGNKKK
ncbi:ERV/ALR sulfhydryl oxidase domain-containing protein [Cokeromyces recurvatus]|uniref:ERV/ALR sulfhydryl oxidase domain-containing protein n=1 Tax=Cokeromyces recurvatus TaxID=90255 RepID=UPI002220E37B|nr:ERV/ALR sulfhydryl oxidase domain-containing protein [Cokeromyces recurvatus]KAI7900582.1 ERV/ALR sulfhydryl oxidase domain-containing protein [Cokeromyces recurvatus]